MISIVIVNWNSGPLLERCVQSIRRNAEEAQILIVDNASTDGSAQFAQNSRGAVALLRNSENAGYAAANNIGWRSCSGDPVLFLNPDIECFPGSIDLLNQTLAADSSLWAAGGQLIGLDGKPQTGFNVRAFPSVCSVAAESFFLDELWPSNPWSGANNARQDLEADVDQPAAACLMLSRKALETLDGFDESFRPAWFEDVDLCKRIHSRGGRIRYQPKARFLHHGGHSLEKLSRQEFLESFHSNQIRYFFKHYGSGAASRVRRLTVAGLLLRSAISFAVPLAPRQSRTASVKTFWNAARFVSRQRKATP